MKKKAKDVKKAKAAEDDNPFEQLLKLTKLMKGGKIRVAPKPIARGPNKWRSENPKFGPKPEKSGNVVRVGEMDVDVSLKDEYEQWRLDKLEEQKHHRLEAERRARAAKIRNTPRPGLI